MGLGSPCVRVVRTARIVILAGVVSVDLRPLAPDLSPPPATPELHNPM